MASQNGTTYGYTGLFPIAVAQSSSLRTYLRSLDDSQRYPRGSPLSNVPIIHMARLAVIDTLPCQEMPARVDALKSHYLLFACDFDGGGVDVLIRDMVRHVPDQLTAIWGHCIRFPGTPSCDLLAAYFERCQLETNLFLADQPQASVDDILMGLMCRRRLGDFMRQLQHKPRDPAVLKRGFQLLWRSLQSVRPLPGEL